MKKIFKQNGFTLVELLVAMAILGMLIAGILAAAAIARRSGRDTVTKNNMQAIQLALEDFTGSDGRYPIGTANGSCTGATSKNVCMQDNDTVKIGSSSVDFKSGAPLQSIEVKTGVTLDGLSNDEICDLFTNTVKTTKNTSDKLYLGFATNANNTSFALATRLENGNCYVLTTK